MLVYPQLLWSFRRGPYVFRSHSLLPKRSVRFLDFELQKRDAARFWLGAWDNGAVRFNLRGPRVLQEVLLTNWGLVPPRVLVCQHDEVTKPTSTVVVSCLKCTRVSTIVLSFQWGHEEPPGVDLRAAIVWLENWNERSTFALEFCGGFVAVGTF